MKKFKARSLALSLIMLATPVMAEVSVTGTLTSDYVFRGISQTDSSPAIQLGVDYAHNNGFFVGAWGSNVDFGDDANTELDLFVGYSGNAQNFSYDANFVYYTYQGYESEDEANYGEIIVNAYIDAITITIGYASDYAQLGESVTYFGAAYDIELPHDVSLTLQSGYSIGEEALGQDYIDYSATIAKTFNGFDLSAAIINTDISDDDSAEARLVLTASRAF